MIGTTISIIFKKDVFWVLPTTSISLAPREIIIEHWSAEFGRGKLQELIALRFIILIINGIDCNYTKEDQLLDGSEIAM